MSIGPSGRIVIEVDPETKSRLHAVLKSQDTTLKDWFLRHVLDELDRSEQLPLDLRLESDRLTHPQEGPHGQA